MKQYPALQPAACSSTAQRVPNATTLWTVRCDEICCISSKSHNCKHLNANDPGVSLDHTNHLLYHQKE